MFTESITQSFLCELFDVHLDQLLLKAVGHDVLELNVDASLPKVELACVFDVLDDLDEQAGVAEHAGLQAIQDVQKQLALQRSLAKMLVDALQNFLNILLEGVLPSLIIYLIVLCEYLLHLFLLILWLVEVDADLLLDELCYAFLQLLLFVLA